MANFSLLGEFIDSTQQMVRSDQAIALMPSAFMKSLLLVVEETSGVVRDQAKSLDTKQMAARLLCQAVRVYRGAINELNQKKPNLRLNIRSLLTKGTQFVSKKTSVALASFIRELDSINLIRRLKRSSGRMDRYSAELGVFLPQGQLLPGPARLRARVGELNTRLGTTTARLVAKTREARVIAENLVKKEGEIVDLQNEIVALRQQLIGVSVPASAPPVTTVQVTCTCKKDVEELEILYGKAHAKCGVLMAEKEFAERDLEEAGRKLEQCETMLRRQGAECEEAFARETEADNKYAVLSAQFDELQKKFTNSETELFEVREQLSMFFDNQDRNRETRVVLPRARYPISADESDVRDLFDDEYPEEVPQNAATVKSRKRRGNWSMVDDEPAARKSKEATPANGVDGNEQDFGVFDWDVPQMDMGGGVNLNLDNDANLDKKINDERMSGPLEHAQGDILIDRVESDMAQPVAQADANQNARQTTRAGHVSEAVDVSSSLSDLPQLQLTTVTTRDPPMTQAVQGDLGRDGEERQANDADGKSSQGTQGSSNVISSGSSSSYQSCASSQHVDDEARTVEGVDDSEKDEETNAEQKDEEKSADDLTLLDPMEVDDQRQREEDGGEEGGVLNADDPFLSGDEEEDMDTSDNSTAPATAPKSKRSSWNPLNWFRR